MNLPEKGKLNRLYGWKGLRNRNMRDQVGEVEEEGTGKNNEIGTILGTS